MGGDCLNFGCVPSKAILRAARAVADLRRAHEFGIQLPDNWRVDFPAIMERMRRLRSQIAVNDSAERFRSLGVDVFEGEGRFSGAKTVDVNGTRLSFRKAVIATGTRPALPPIPGLAEAGFLTNESVFSLTELPGRLAVIGGGPIGCELSQAFARFGAQVTLLQRGPQLLPRDDPDGVRIIEAALRRDGVQILLNCRIRAIEGERDKSITFEQNGTSGRIQADAILVAVGRTPNVSELNLETAGVVYDRERGVHVNDRLQTSNRHIFAAGDVCSQLRFTHAADAMARLVVRNALFMGRGKVSQLGIPWCTYTDPEIAHVGLVEHDARGVSLRTFVQSMEHVDRAILDGETDGLVKIQVRSGTDRIVGATIVARHAGDMISEVSVARSTHTGLGKLSGIIHPYPTQAEAIRKIGDQYLRTRLTPFAKWVVKKWLTWIISA